jgi:predicted exporter
VLLLNRPHLLALSLARHSYLKRSKRQWAILPVATSLTGPTIISDAEFAGVHQGAATNGVVNVVFVLAILAFALRSIRLVAAVVVNLVVGLAITAAGGILMVGALNPMSLAFAVLFVGPGADFAIQYTVRYRAEHCAAEPPAQSGLRPSTNRLSP